MGNAQNKNNPKKDRQALLEFLKGKANLDKIWKRFDRDGNVKRYLFIRKNAKYNDIIQYRGLLMRNDWKI